MGPGLAQVGDLSPVPSPQEESPRRKAPPRGTGAPPPTGPGHGQIPWLPLVGHVPDSALQRRCTSDREHVELPASRCFSHCCSAASPARLPHLRGPRSVLSAPRGLPLSHLCPSNTGITWSWCSHLFSEFMAGSGKIPEENLGQTVKEGLSKKEQIIERMSGLQNIQTNRKRNSQD